MINGKPVHWLSQKQHSISQSSTEAGFVALNGVARELIWFQSLLNELLNKHLITTIYTDNQAAKEWCTGPVMKHSRAKHIDSRYKYVRQLVLDNKIQIEWISTIKMLADILTKALPTETFN